MNYGFLKIRNNIVESFDEKRTPESSFISAGFFVLNRSKIFEASAGLVLRSLTIKDQRSDHALSLHRVDSNRRTRPPLEIDRAAESLCRIRLISRRIITNQPHSALRQRRRSSLARYLKGQGRVVAFLRNNELPPEVFLLDCTTCQTRTSLA